MFTSAVTFPTGKLVAPRFKIPVQKITGINFSGPTLNPAYKEVIVTSSGKNVIATFYWPEIFDTKS